jgi:hypothetical protein
MSDADVRARLSESAEFAHKSVRSKDLRGNAAAPAQNIGNISRRSCGISAVLARLIVSPARSR